LGLGELGRIFLPVQFFTQPGGQHSLRIYGRRTAGRTADSRAAARRSWRATCGRCLRNRTALGRQAACAVTRSFVAAILTHSRDFFYEI
jgi:hypothetical protein